jgi:hypothetical protein
MSDTNPSMPANLIPVTISDQLGNEYLLHAFPEAPYGLLLALQSFQTETDPVKQVGAVNDCLNMAFPPHEAEQLSNLVRSAGGPTTNAVMGLFQTLMESWFGNPTTGLSESSLSDGATSTSSEAASQPTEATPLPSTPETGLPPVISS